MREIDEQTRSLLDRIVDGRSRKIHAIPLAERCAALEELGRTAPPAAIPWVLPFLVPERPARGLLSILPWAPRRDPNAAEVATAAAVSMLSRARVLELPRIDESVRTVWAGWGTSSWDELSSPQELPVCPASPVGPLALASFHRDGRVREKAVSALARHEGVGELPFLVLRLNDWVEPIRALALREVLRRIEPRSLEPIVACLPLIDRLEELRRGDHTAVLTAVGDLLESPIAVTALGQGIEDEDLRVRRACVRRLSRCREVPWPDVFARTARDPDLPIRLWTARETLASSSPAEARALLSALARDPHLAVRREALRGLLTLDPAAAHDHLEGALLDRTACIREFARFYLRKFGARTDFAEFYRGALDACSPAALRAVIAGLGETGRAADVALIEPHLASPSSKVVQITLKALQRLAPEATRATLFGYLSDHRPGVTNMACTLLQPSVGDEDFTALRTAITGRAPVEAKFPLHKLVVALEAWPRLRLLLDFPGERDTRVAERQNAALSQWCHDFAHSLYPPRDPDALELEDAAAGLARRARAIDDRVRERLAKILAAQGAGARR